MKGGIVRGFFKQTLSAFIHNRLALSGMTILLLIILLCIGAPFISGDPNQIDALNILQGISWQHWLGTDEFGRDVLARVLYGGRISLLVGCCSMVVSTLVGTAIGILSGYTGGKFDEMMMRLTDIFLALPSMLLMVILNAFLKPSILTLVLVLSMFSWASIARVVRAETLSLKERDFIIASQNLGASNWSIMRNHILPNIIHTIIVSATLRIGAAILAESSLSFLGLGVRIPQASWGSMLQNAQNHILDAPLLAVVPGTFIFLTVLSFNLIGDGLQLAMKH